MPKPPWLEPSGWKNGVWSRFLQPRFCECSAKLFSLVWRARSRRHQNDQLNCHHDLLLIPASTYPFGSHIDHFADLPK